MMEAILMAQYQHRNASNSHSYRNNLCIHVSFACTCMYIMYVCMYDYMYFCMYACIYVCMYVCIFVYIYMYVCMCV